MLKSNRKQRIFLISREIRVFSSQTFISAAALVSYKQGRSQKICLEGAAPFKTTVDSIMDSVTETVCGRYWVYITATQLYFLYKIPNC